MSPCVSAQPIATCCTTSTALHRIHQSASHTQLAGSPPPKRSMTGPADSTCATRGRPTSRRPRDPLTHGDGSAWREAEICKIRLAEVVHRHDEETGQGHRAGDEPEDAHTEHGQEVVAGEPSRRRRVERTADRGCGEMVDGTVGDAERGDHDDDDGHRDRARCLGEDRCHGHRKGHCRHGNPHTSSVEASGGSLGNRRSGHCARRRSN